MHASSFENMQKCYRKYVAGGPLESRMPLRVLDIGGANVNGSYADIFNDKNVEYLGADLNPGDGVEIILDDPNTLPLEDQSVDIVISGQMLEHCEFFWIIFTEMVRVLKPDGLIFLIAPSAGPIHNYPVDCYRFYPDAYRALAKHARCFLVDAWHDKRGPWNDLVGVFNKTGANPESHGAANISKAIAVNALSDINTTPYEKTQGETPYLSVLKSLHETIRPHNYLEIGVRNGRSLALAQCDAVGVDPAPDVDVELPTTSTIIHQTSDEFFEDTTATILKKQPELIFIDGMHLFEFALRDFMNIEQISGPNTVVVIDDIFPNEPQQASRKRKTRVWCGDVWKLYHILKKYRPDLCFIPLDASPTGLLIITSLNPGNRTLWNMYNPIVREALSMPGDPGARILGRENAVPPSSETFRRCLEIIHQAKDSNAGIQYLKEKIEAELVSNISAGLINNKPLKLSVVVIAYNMARELPRTLKSLSPSMQNGMHESEYEIIVVDNGSTHPFDHDHCKSISPNIQILTVDNASHSPVAAINNGIAQARGDLVGVMIDGARMASPGLLRSAINAANTDPNAIVGTIAFHLGDAVQAESMKNGYNQTVEDDLLASIAWQKNAYGLFDISVFAGSSARGWFSVPSECNALFMRPRHWQELGGFDERFQQPGGGLANLDMWNRACRAPFSQIVMLLGEATFHQFHSGIATNSSVDHWQDYDAEYEAIRGRPFSRPDVDAVFYGGINRGHNKNCWHSL